LGLKLLLKSSAPVNRQVPVVLRALIQGGGEILRSEVHRFSNYIWNKEELLQRWKKSVVYLYARRTIKLTVLLKHHKIIFVFF
jgi:hypothetical protein